MDELTTKLLDMILQLEKLAPHVWSIMVRQSYVSAAGNLTGATMSFVATAALIWLAGLLWKRHEADPYSEAEVAFWAIVCVGVVTFAVGCCLLIAAIQVLVNPEYYAIMALIAALK